MHRVHAILSIFCLFAVVGGMLPPYIANVQLQPALPEAVQTASAAAAVTAVPTSAQAGADTAVPTSGVLAAEAEALTAALNEQAVRQAAGQGIVLPTPNLEPNSGYAGQQIAVSGEAPADARACGSRGCMAAHRARPL